MKHTKLILTFMFVLLAISLLPSALAQDTGVNNTTSVDETIDESEGIQLNTIYAEYRFLGIKLAIENNIDKGNDIIERILENDSEADVNELENIIVQMEDLLDRIDELNTSAPTTELRDEYILIKEEAKQLTADFRELVKDFFPEEERNMLRKEINERNKERRTELKQMLEKTRNRYNAEKTLELFKELDIEDTDLIKKVESGEANRGNIQSAVVHAMNALSKEERTAFKEERKAQEELGEQKKVEVKERIKNKIDDLKDKQMVRKENQKSANINGRK